MAELKKLELVVKETNNKSGRYLYQVMENDKVLCERRSNRVYVACAVTRYTVEGETDYRYGSPFYFGRLDLINKGSSKNFATYNSAYAFAYVKTVQ